MCLQLLCAEVHHVCLTVLYWIHSKVWQLVCIEGQEASRTSWHKPVHLNWSKWFITASILVVWLWRLFETAKTEIQCLTSYLKYNYCSGTVHFYRPSSSIESKTRFWSSKDWKWYSFPLSGWGSGWIRKYNSTAKVDSSL